VKPIASSPPLQAFDVAPNNEPPSYPNDIQ